MSDGLTEAWKTIKMNDMDKSAGLLIIMNNKILLCHTQPMQIGMEHILYQKV
jgi:hypothetical protein